MNKYTVLLDDGTEGYVTSANAPKLGYEMTVTVYDESGEPGKATGVIRKILTEKSVRRAQTPASDYKP